MLLVAFRTFSINRWNLISQPWYLHSQIVSAAVTPIKTVWGPVLEQMLFCWNQVEHNFSALPPLKRCCRSMHISEKHNIINTTLTVTHWSLCQPWQHWKKYPKLVVCSESCWRCYLTHAKYIPWHFREMDHSDSRMKSVQIPMKQTILRTVWHPNIN